MKLNLEEVSAIRVNSEKETATIWAPDGKEQSTFDITDIDWIAKDSYSPVARLRNALLNANFRLVGGWFYLNQNDVWNATNPSFDNGVA